MPISDWISYLCSSVLSAKSLAPRKRRSSPASRLARHSAWVSSCAGLTAVGGATWTQMSQSPPATSAAPAASMAARMAGLSPSMRARLPVSQPVIATRSEEHTSELQSLMRISYAVFCLKKKKHKIILYQLIILHKIKKISQYKENKHTTQT